MMVALALTGVGVGAPAALAQPRHSNAAVAVLSVPGLAAVGVPAGLTPSVVASELHAQGVDAHLASLSDLSDAQVIVNPYGEAVPAGPEVKSALDNGAAWVNLAGVPFLRPAGTVDASAPATFGVFAPPTPSSWFTGTVTTELGNALLPALSPRWDDHDGWTVHAATPADERPLADYIDAAGIDGGPAITLILHPYRVVAAGYLGEASPLNPARPEAAPLIAQMVRVAAEQAGGITSLTTRTVGDQLQVSALGDGKLTGVGTFAAPSPWSPDQPTVQVVTVRLFRAGRLVDLRSVPANPAVVSTSGEQILVNGQPFVVKGAAQGGSFPPKTPPLEQAATKRQDYQRMRSTGIDAVRSYGYLSDWEANAAARAGLFVMDALPLGALTDASVKATVPWARFIGARDAMFPNLLIYSLGNETQNSGPGDPSLVAAQLQTLDDAIKATDARRHPITYAAAEEEPWLLGALPFLDVYGYNTYGATYPFAYDSAGFDASLKIARTIAGSDRPLLVTEWGVNATPTGQAALVTGSDVAPAQIPAALAIKQKWQTLRGEGAAGGYYFQWSDALKTGFPLPVPLYEQTLGAVEYPEGSGYRPANEEDFWGLNDIYRNPRATLPRSKRCTRTEVSQLFVATSTSLTPAGRILSVCDGLTAG